MDDVVDIDRDTCVDDDEGELLAVADFDGVGVVLAVDDTVGVALAVNDPVVVVVGVPVLVQRYGTGTKLAGGTILVQYTVKNP